MNIFKMSLEDAEKAIDNVLNDMTKAEIVKELENCGFEVEESQIYNINANPYMYKDTSSVSLFKTILGQVKKKVRSDKTLEAA